MSAINPFRVVKANEFTITQIIDNWVPLAGSEDGFIAPLNPQELMPKYILGSKGCGKTHLLRYYSFDARWKYHKADIKALLKKDKYLASYSRLDSISSSRFNKCSDEEEWRLLYNYYFELIQSIVALDVYERVVLALGVSKNNVSRAIEGICQKTGISLEESSIFMLKEFLNKQRVSVDNEIIDYAFTKVLDWNHVRPVFTFGSLLFEIPEMFSRFVSELQDVHYIYILDEYEKLKCDWQKESLNTLVYEKKNNCTFWVGARKIGYTTRNTLSGEPIHEGHEFNPVDLDSLLKANEAQFATFAEKLFQKRLDVNGIIMEDSLLSLFEKFDEKVFLKTLLQKGDSLKHWRLFKERLSGAGIEEKEIAKLQQQLKEGVEEDLIGQKIKLYSFYLLWSKKKKSFTPKMVPKLVEDVNHSYDAYKEGHDSKMKELHNKFRQDMVAQLAEENQVTLYQYSGFDKLIKIADCNPRIFLTLMKLIIDDCHFRGDDPFKGGKAISVRSQYAGINETAKWFLKDIEVYGKEREDLDIATNHLLNFFYICRFCDKPTETSLCSFYYRMNTGQNRIDHVIELALQEAFLLEVPNKRKDKTLGTPQKSYQINRLIATVYNLPIARRGVTSITPDMMSAIFDPECFDKFTALLTAHKIGLNAPFLIKKERIEKKQEKEKAPKKKLIESKDPSLFD